MEQILARCLVIHYTWEEALILKSLEHTLKLRMNDLKRATLKEDNPRMWLAEEDIELLEQYIKQLKEMTFVQ